MSKLLPYETIVKAHEGDPDAIDTILSHYAGYIRYCSKVHGKVNAEVEEHIKQQLIAALNLFWMLELEEQIFPRCCDKIARIRSRSIRLPQPATQSWSIHVERHRSELRKLVCR